MKETIYTIPINDAFNSDCDCPFCFILKKLDDEKTDAAVGAAMMEPDHRQVSNEKGFCREHIVKMQQKQKVLPLALVMQSYIDTKNNEIFSLFEKKAEKKGLFSKASAKETAGEIIDKLNRQSMSCAICDELNYQLDRYAANTVDMWKSDSEFKPKFAEKSFCTQHLELILSAAVKRLNDKEFDEFFSVIKSASKKRMTELYGDITDFVNSFDYRFSGELSDNAKNAVKACIKNYFGADI